MITNLGNDYWWMGPDYKFHDVGGYGHWEWGKDYLLSINKYPASTNLVYQSMYNLGWIRVCKILYNDGEIVMTYNYDSKKPPTIKQIKAIHDWAIENGCSIMRDDTLGKNYEFLQESINEEVDKPYGGWLSPDCKFFPVKFWGHISFAYKVFKELNIPSTTITSPCQKMYELGWVRILFNDEELMYEYNLTHKPTSRQVKAIKDLAIEYHCVEILDSMTQTSISGYLEEENGGGYNSPYDTPYGGWLSPEGEFTEVNCMAHSRWANEYCMKKRIPVPVVADSIYDTMHKMGWIRIVCPTDKSLKFEYYKNKSPTPKQMRVIKDLAIEWGMNEIFDDTKQKYIGGFLEEWGHPDEDNKPYGGWLDPNGKFYKVGYQAHFKWANTYLRNKYPNADFSRPYTELLKMNWVRIIFDGEELQIEYRMDSPTQKQKKAIGDLAIEYGCDEIYDTIKKQMIGGLLQEYKLNEGVSKPKTLYVGIVLPEENYKVIAYDSYHNPTRYGPLGHSDINKKHPDILNKLYLSWRYRKDLNTVFWWHNIPGNIVTDEVDYWIERNTGMKNPHHERMNKEKFELSHTVNEQMYPKDFDRNALGSCMAATQMATEYFLKKGIADFKIVEGWIAFGEEGEDWAMYKKNGRWVEYQNVFSHTWIEFKNGRIFDPTKKQWKNWGFNPDEGKIVKINKKYSPQEYLNICFRHPSNWEKFKKELKENMTYDELLKLTTDDRKERASDVNVRSLPISMDENREQWNFRYKSSPTTTTTDKPFKGAITFLKGEVGSKDDATKLECKVDCSCEDFMYRFAYNDAAKGASKVGPDSLSGCINRKPKPAYDYGEGLCKHLTALGKYLRTKITSTKKSNLFEAIGEVAKQGPFNVEYYD